MNYDKYTSNEDYDDYLLYNPRKKMPWFLSIWFIFFLSAFSFLIIPGIIAIILIIKRQKYDENKEKNFIKLSQDSEILQKKCNFLEVKAKKEKEEILNLIQDRENEVLKTKNKLINYSDILEESLNKSIRSMNLFCNKIDEFREESLNKEYINEYYDGYYNQNQDIRENKEIDNYTKLTGTCSDINTEQENLEDNQCKTSNLSEENNKIAQINNDENGFDISDAEEDNYITMRIKIPDEYREN